MARVRFLHIPKCAGISFQDCLKRVYGGQCFSFSGDLQRDLDRYHRLGYSGLAGITVFTGHSPRITGVTEIDALTTVTLLRRPVDRVLSFCQHVSEGKSPHLVERFPPDTFDLTAFLECGDRELSNFQTKTLLGDETFDLPQDEESTLARRAARVLEKEIDCFGIVEEFERSLVLFRHMLGWNRWPVYRTLNARNRSKPMAFDEDHVRRIRELNRVDLQVYENAVSLFHRRISGMPGSLNARVAILRGVQVGAQATRLFASGGDALKRLPRRCIKRVMRLAR